MKKGKVLLAAALLGTIGYGGYNAYANAVMSDAERMMLANVEALTINEPGGGGADYEFPDAYPFTTTCNVETSKRSKCKVTVISCQGSGYGCNSQKCPTHKR